MLYSSKVLNLIKIWILQMKLQGDKSGRKGHLSVTTEVFEVAPSLHMVELRKTRGDTLEFHKACEHDSDSHFSFEWHKKENKEQWHNVIIIVLLLLY